MQVREEGIVRKGRVLSCLSYENDDPGKGMVFKFSSRKHVASEKTEEVVELCDPFQKMPSYSSFDPCTITTDEVGRVTRVLVAQKKYKGLRKDKSVPKRLITKELVAQKEWTPHVVRAQLRNANVPEYAVSFSSFRWVRDPQLKDDLEKLLVDHCRGESYFALSLFIPPPVLRKRSVEEMYAFCNTLKESPWTLSFAHSISASIKEELIVAGEDGFSPEQREEKLLVLEFLHHIPENRGAKTLADVATFMKSKSPHLTENLFLAADAYIPLAEALEDHAEDTVYWSADEEELRNSLVNMGLAKTISNSNLSLSRAVKLNQKLREALITLFQELPRDSSSLHQTREDDDEEEGEEPPNKRLRTTKGKEESNDDEEDIVNRMSEIDGGVPSLVSHKVGDKRFQRKRTPADLLQEKIKQTPLVLVRSSGNSWALEYAHLFAEWKHPTSKIHGGGLENLSPKAIFVSPSAAHSKAFYEMIGFGSLVAERVEFGKEVHERHLEDTLSDVQQEPEAIEYLVLENAQQFDVVTMLETLQMGLDIFCNLKCIIMIGDDQLYPPPARMRPLEEVHGLISPCGQVMGAPFHDLVQHRNNFPEGCVSVIEIKYKEMEPYNCVSQDFFEDPNWGLQKLRSGEILPGIQLLSIPDITVSPTGIDRMASMIRVWKLETEQAKREGSDVPSGVPGNPPLFGMGEDTIILLSTPDTWTAERCWEAADFLADELRLECDREPYVNSIRYTGERVYLDTGLVDIIEACYSGIIEQPRRIENALPVGKDVRNGVLRKNALLQLKDDPISDHRNCNNCKHLSNNFKKSQLMPAFGGAHGLRSAIVVPAKLWRPVPTPFIFLFPVSASATNDEELEKFVAPEITDLRTAISYATQHCVIIEHSCKPLKLRESYHRKTALPHFLDFTEEEEKET